MEVDGRPVGCQGLWVPETPQRLRDLRVFVDQAAAPIASDHRDGRVRGHRWEGSDLQT